MGQDIFRILSLFIINLIVSSKYSDQQPPSLDNPYLLLCFLTK